MNGKNALGLYVHIPFCVKKCNYCDFLSAPASEGEKLQYITALKQEIISYSELVKEYDIKSIFFGGGTPSALDEFQLTGILKVIKAAFCISDEKMKRDYVEITVECNPGTLNEKKLAAYQKAGINRLSFGLQSIYEEELKLLGRVHTYDEFLNNYKIARTLGFQNINIDLMSGLPGQTVVSWEQTLKQVIALRPEHISAYSLIIEEGTPFYQIYSGTNSKELGSTAHEMASEKTELPDEEEERRMYERTKQLLSESGYLQYEISNYAKPNKQCIHNSFYWIGTEYIGFGLGASSLIKNERYHNPSMMSDYLESAFDFNRLKRDSELLSKKQQMEEFMFLGLRMTDGISSDDFYQRFGKTIESVFGEPLYKLEQNGLLSRTKDKFYLTSFGIDISNQVFCEFLLE